jgi:ABC-type phosphate/phosphonate transport system substrate-binding protein
MVKFTHLLVLSALVFWLAGSGCVGNDTSKVEEPGVNPNFSEAGNGAAAENLEIGLTPTEIKELGADMEDLDKLLADASLDEDITIEGV